MTLSISLRGLIQPAALLRPLPRQMPRPNKPSPREEQHRTAPSVNLGGVHVTLLDSQQAVDLVIERARTGQGLPPLGVASANLDHVKHFGSGSRWEGILDGLGSTQWLTLLDGAPLVARAQELTRTVWPRLAGSDLIGPILDAAQTSGLRVGFVGGSPDTHALAEERLAGSYPGLAVAGWWAPDRTVLSDVEASRALAGRIAASSCDVLVVCLGKPRQELWISEYGHLTGAKVLLAFGAVVDFLAGRVRRAPARVQALGMEWAWRLALEPQRLAKRYLVDGPEAYVKLQKSSGDVCRSNPSFGRHSAGASPGESPALPRQQRPEGFSPVTEHTDVAVLVVAYNGADDVVSLLASLLPETCGQSIKVIIADNSPTDAVCRALRDWIGVHAFRTGGNFGYSGGINRAMREAGTADTYLVLNPDLRVEAGSVLALRERMSVSGAGVVVPVLLDDDGSVYPSLRREPSIAGAVGDALMGSRLAGRPDWLAEMDFDAESYAHAHRLDWATGAALLIRRDVADSVGEWDEDYFLYSEETDYLHRVREAGASVWFEPLARMRHSRGGSGSSPALDALMAVNRIKYVRKYHSAGYSRGFRAAVVLAALLRLPRPQGGKVFGMVCRERRWEGLPRATGYPAPVEHLRGFPAGAVIIPAHNEAAVLRRTLDALTAPLASGAVEVIVACNGCTDGTEAIAGSFDGVQVLSVAEASKVAALNAADRVATRWPRVYLDADIELPAEALRVTLECLAGGDNVLCARPGFRYEVGGATWPVRSYYRARNRLPQATASMWGAGVYALSRQGHDRLGVFPAVTADDCYVDRLFDGTEKTVLDCPPVTVRTPRTTPDLLAILRRVYKGNAELSGMTGAGTRLTVRELARSARGAGPALDAVVYAAFALLGRRARPGGVTWERDESTRS
ncbi:WecB/TagA/CpsF family glycosyltransferase [Pseudarthrobacter sp. B4EP4b]|uniref:WecB/TagA/CpsF family glycosyltransferase n=1 Tax=Pseudarthrobacter sp. B4EP4b TaxID=2590664 RepID=UPI002104A1CE|nr:WecB/TagA/CpsF family glycosyltransferase [Pseudarthrobacter sp. B4EP4b]